MREGRTETDGLLYKIRIAKEETFYRVAKMEHPQIYHYMPEYHCTIMNDDNNINKDGLIVLEDLTKGMMEPCIVDVKIGFSLEDPEATEEECQRRRLKALGSTSHTLGYRISGIRWIDSHNKEVILRKKDILPDMSPLLLFSEWVGAADDINNSNKRDFLVDYFIKEMADLLRTLKQHLPPGAYLRSSSILLIYDKKEFKDSRMKMIDFAHCDFFGNDNENKHQNKQQDSNYIDGLSSLIEMFQRLKR